MWMADATVLYQCTNYIFCFSSLSSPSVSLKIVVCVYGV